MVMTRTVLHLSFLFPHLPSHFFPFFFSLLLQTFFYLKTFSVNYYKNSYPKNTKIIFWNYMKCRHTYLQNYVWLRTSWRHKDNSRVIEIKEGFQREKEGEETEKYSDSKGVWILSYQIQLVFLSSFLVILF